MAKENASMTSLPC